MPAQPLTRMRVHALQLQQSDEVAARSNALSSWASNPEVDCLIGRKLAEKYRFAEGAAAQRRALGLDPAYMPAKVQLCEALLRLGEEEEGWKLAAEIFAADAYNVVAYNLVTLHDRVSAFRTLRQDGFLVRMDPKEADLYGWSTEPSVRQAEVPIDEHNHAIAALRTCSASSTPRAAFR